MDVVTGIADPREIEIDSSTGTLYWVEHGTGRIRTSDLDGNDQMDLITGLPTGSLGTTGLGLDLVNQKIYWAEDAGTDSIGRANLDGTGQEVFLTLPFHQPISVAVDPLGQYVYWSDFTPNEVHRVGIDGTGDVVLLSANRPTGLVIASSTVPEPSSLVVMAFGAFGALALRRRRTCVVGSN